MSFSRFHPYPWLPLVFVFGAAGCRPAQDQTLPALTTVQQVRAMKAEDGERGYPVRLQGVVTYYHAQSRSLIVQAGAEGVFVDTGKTPVPLTAGQEVAIEGSTGPGGSSVIVLATRLTVVKAGTMPASERVSIAQMSSGDYSYRRVQAEGIVRSSVRENDGRLTLNIAAVDGMFQARVIEGSGTTFSATSMNSFIQDSTGGIFMARAAAHLESRQVVDVIGIESSAIPCTVMMRRAESAAPAIARRRRNFSLRVTCDSTKHEHRWCPGGNGLARAGTRWLHMP